ncbi:HlyD family secretion protein [Duganella sp. FT27W]|uniref:HlyD family secretion protein n=1 Tax=Duganella sp. FT27W TaxID=2654636 RepID=UPI00128AFA1E|nr:HlyD family secretion protein [Duganella sp. FT27W]MPQ58646.1 HlyD family efflux transporter periplasmic adaptor subunit [Duganella sp. FT27W]
MTFTTRRRAVLALSGAGLLALAVAAGLALGRGSGAAVAAAATPKASATAVTASIAAPNASAAAVTAAIAVDAVGRGNEAAPRPVLLTGEVEALDSQTILVPPSNSSPLVLRNFVAEGSHVKTGDLVLRIETADAANLERYKTELEQARARAERETANLDVAAVETGKALVSAQAALDKAKVDAALPKVQISALDYDRHQAELDRATRDLAIKRDADASARTAVDRRSEDGALEIRKLQINLAFQIAQLAQSEVRAQRDGVVVHGYSPWMGTRFEEGSSAWPGNAAGVVLGNGEMAVTAWALEADRPYLAEGQAVDLRFDALPATFTRAVAGTIKSITSAPEARASWGRGRYFRVKIGLPAGHALALVPGMSVQVEPRPAKAAVSAQASAPAPVAASDALTVEGEIASRSALPVAPPSIPYIWQYKLAQIAPEGALLEAGQPIAQFESNDVTTRLVTQQGALQEKLRALDKLKLDQAEADRAGELAVAEARSNADKADRKATMPKELIRRVDYDKLVIDRVEKNRLATLVATQHQAQIRARHAERTWLQAEIAQLQAQLAALVKGKAALAVLAPRRGMVVYRTSFDGQKFSAGSQVWMGLSVATLADPEQLYVAASVPEAQSSRVRVGQAARVTVPGSNLTLDARVVALGRAFHGKSRAQALIVRDVELQFDGKPAGLKPGAAVQAVLLADTAQPAPSVSQR